MSLSGEDLTDLANILNSYQSKCHSQPGIEVGVDNLDFDSFMPSVIPQLIPTGDYRALIRFHTSKNETILQVLVTVNIDAIDKIKAYDMGWLLKIDLISVVWK